MKDISTTITTSWSAFIAFVGAMNADEWLFVIGALGTVVSVIVTWIYKHKELKLKQRYYGNKVGSYGRKD